MRLEKFLYVLIITLLSSLHCFSQDSKIIEMMNDGEYEEVVQILSTGKSLEKMELGNLSALGLSYIKLKNYTDAELVYQEITSRRNANIKHSTYYGEILFINKKFDKAKEAFNTFLEAHPDNKDALLKIQSCDSVKKWQNYSTDVTIDNIENLNTPYEEKSSLRIDDKMVFVSNRIPKAYRNNPDLSKNALLGYLIMNDSLEVFQEDLMKDYTCQAMDYCAATDMLAFTLRKKKKYLEEVELSKAGIYFRNLNAESDSLILFHWDDCPEDINIAHPAFSVDGKRLYFASDMPGGQGGNDLYYSDFKNGKWSEPVNLGEHINTNRHEVYPVAGGDTVLYYSSDGMPGYGNLDVFMSEIQGDNFGKPVNLKAPVNSIGNDFSYYKTDEYRGYLTSNRSSMSKGMNDLFKHERPEPVIVEKEEEPEEEPEEILVFNPENFKPHPVFFDINKAEIDEVFSAVLNQIADTLKTYDDISLCVIGHSGTKGPVKFSKKLAGERAENIKSYLIEKGVDKDRITTKNAGITKDRNVDGVDYHVQIGSLKASDAKKWYADKLENNYNIHRFKNGEYSVYAVGNCRNKKEAQKLKDTIESEYGLESLLVICSSKDKLLADCYYAFNRRVSFEWK